MPLDPAKIAELDAIYGTGGQPSLSPEKIAQLDAIYGVSSVTPKKEYGAFDSALMDIGRNTKENLFNTFTATGEAMSEPFIGANTPAAMMPLDFVMRSAGKIGNALGGVYGTIAALPAAALTASVENSGVIPAAASAIKSNLVPDDPRFSANISPEAQHQIAQGIGGDLNNAVFMGVGGLQGQRMRDAKAGIVTPKPYNPITETIAPAVRKFEAASQKLPSILGDTSEGVSINTALGGVPDAVAIRAKGAFAMSPDARNEVSQQNWDSASQLFKQSTANGAVLDNGAAQNLLNTVRKSIGRLNSRTAETSGVLADFEAAIKSGNVTPDMLHEFRQNFSDVISSNTKSKIDGGGINIDGKKALEARNAISDAMSQLTQKDLSAGTPQAISDMLEGINKTAQAHRYDRVAQILDDAQGNSDAIKRGFTKLLKNTKGYSPKEIAVFKEAANRGLVEHVERGLGTFGLDLGKTKNVALPVLTGGSAGLGIPGGVPLVAGGTLARQTGKFAARGKAQNALDAVMSRNTSPPAAPPSPLPNAPFKPYGLLPAPQTTISVNSYGQAIPLTAAGREILGKQAPTFNRRLGAASDADKAAFSESWDKLDAEQQALIGKQMERAWAKDMKTPISSMVAQAKQAMDDLIAVTGNDVKNPAMREALIGAVRQPTMKEIMAMKPGDARKAFQNYKMQRANP